jgi:Tol biopolymer transport system component
LRPLHKPLSGKYFPLLSALLFLIQAVTGQISSSKSPFNREREPTLFEPGVVSIGAATTYRPAFAPDGRSVYYTLELGSGYLILVSHYKKGRWMRPEIAPFSGQYSDAEPFMAPDGSKLFFASKRPIGADNKPRKDYDLWVVERLSNQRWSEPQHLDGAINTDAHELYPAVAADGTLYFSRFDPGGIWRARRVDGRYDVAEKLGAPINSGRKEAGVYVAPDGRYMIFDMEGPDSLGKTDLYISFNRQGEWTAPRNLGATINSSAEETCPVVAPDQRVLFFTSSRKLSGAEVSLGKGLKYSELFRRLNSPGRGRWHIYQVSTDSLGIR